MTVCVRCRPMSEKERVEGRRAVVEVHSASQQVLLSRGSTSTSGGGAEQRAFTFDAAFGPSATQAEVYDATARRIVDSVIDGFNGTVRHLCSLGLGADHRPGNGIVESRLTSCDASPPSFIAQVFAYGQTGTGKTHTMEGGEGEAAGLALRAFGHLFEAIGNAAGDATFLVRASMLEIYNEDIRDLLSKVGAGLIEGGRQRGKATAGGYSCTGSAVAAEANAQDPPPPPRTLPSLAGLCQHKARPARG